MSNELQAEEIESYRNQVADAEWGDGDMPVETAAEPEPQNVEPEEVVEEVVESDDPLAGLDPAVRKMFDDMSNKLDGLNNLQYRLKQAESRVGSLQNAIQNQKQAPTAPVKAAEDTKEWDTLKEDFPEWEEVMDGINKRFDKQGNTDIAAVRIELETDFSKKLSDIHPGFEVKLVGQKHPGWKETVGSAEYAQWLNIQDPGLQEKANESNRSEDAIEVLDKFKEFTGTKGSTVQKKRNERLSRSQTYKGSKPTRTKAVEDMTDTEYRAYLSRQDNI